MDFDSLKISNISSKTNVPKYETRDYTKKDYTKDNGNIDKPNVNNTSANTKKGIEKSDQLNKLANNKSSKGQQSNSKENSTEEDYFKNSSYEEKLSKAMDFANEKLKAVHKQFSYKIHEATNQIIVTIEDSDTGEVIKEVPSEENLDMIAKMRELAGIMIDEKR